MQYKIGVDVYSTEGRKIGMVDRVVIEPDTKEVTHLVVKKGVFFSQDKVIPTSSVASTTQTHVFLNEEAANLDQFPEYEVTQYVPAEEYQPPTIDSTDISPGALYAYPSVDSWLVNRRSGYANPRYVLRSQTNIPEDAVALDHGAKVYSNDGKYIGNVERIFTHPKDEIATHLLISEGLFLKEKKLIPTQWIKETYEDEVHLKVDSLLIANLPVYQPKV